MDAGARGRDRCHGDDRAGNPSGRRFRDGGRRALNGGRPEYCTGFHSRWQEWGALATPIFLTSTDMRSAAVYDAGLRTGLAADEESRGIGTERPSASRCRRNGTTAFLNDRRPDMAGHSRHGVRRGLRLRAARASAGGVRGPGVRPVSAARL